MKRGRFSEERSIGISRQAQAGMRMVALCRKYGISDATFTSGGHSMAAWGFATPWACASLKWRTPPLRKILARQALDISLLKDGLTKNF